MTQTSQPDSSDFNLSGSLVLLAVLCFCTLLYGIAGLPLLGPDEPRYCQVAREMVDSGDWITPTLGGIHWFEKPALAYWLIATGYTAFGVSEFSARLPIALLSALGVFVLFLFGRRIGTNRLGFLSGAVLASSGVWIAFSRAATFDLPLAVSLELALLAFYLWHREGQLRWWYLSCFGMGLATLAKGLIGIVLPGAIIITFLVASGGILSFFRRPAKLLIGGLIFLGTSATWYGPMFWRYGMEFYREFFVAHHFQRFLTNKYHHPQPFYFFTFVLIAGCFPWSLFLVTNALKSLKGWRDALSRSHTLSGFLWIWIIVIIGFFSISTSKLTGYILPVFPAAAVLVGEMLNGWWERRPGNLWRWLCLATGLILVAAAAYPLGQINRLPAATEMQWISMAAVIALLGVLVISLLILKSERSATMAIPFTIGVVLVMVASTLSGTVAQLESTAVIARHARENALTGERLAFYINNDHGIDFYAPSLPLRDSKSELVTPMTLGELEQLLDRSSTGSLLVMSPRQWVNGLESLQIEKLMSYHTWELLRVRRRTATGVGH